MTTSYLTASLSRSKLVRIMHVRWRLFLAILLGVVVFLVLPSDWRPINRVLTGWDIGVAVYLLLAIQLVLSTDTSHIRKRCHLYDEGRVAIPMLSVIAALASLGAIFFRLSSTPAHHRFLNLEFAMGTILLSWTFIQVIFAFHYAHEFYAEHRWEAGGLGFPGEEPPDYWDFLYFAFVIGMTSQVSDVTVKSKLMRRTVMAHGLLSFVFYLAVKWLAAAGGESSAASATDGNRAPQSACNASQHRVPT